MSRLSYGGIVAARILIAVVFVLNGLGIVDQTIPAKELMERGAPVSFWLAAGTPAFQGQLINFSKNIAIGGGLLFIAGSAGQPCVLPRRTVTSEKAGEPENRQIVEVRK